MNKNKNPIDQEICHQCLSACSGVDTCREAEDLAHRVWVTNAFRPVVVLILEDRKEAQTSCACHQCLSACSGVDTEHRNHKHYRPRNVTNAFRPVVVLIHKQAAEELLNSFVSPMPFGL